ncbi:TPA: host specificity protein J, partial [Citrobacter freundii]
RRGGWAVYSNSLDRIITVQTGLDGFAYVPGTVFAFADERLSGRVYGGRITDYDAGLKSITTDRGTSAVPGDTLMIRTQGGTVESRTIQAVNGQQLILATAFTAEPLPNAIFVIDAGQLRLQYFRVTNLTFNDEENTYSITGAEYNGAKYDAVDNNARLDTPPISLLPTGLVGQPTNITISSYDLVRQGQRIATMVASWDAPVDKNGKPQADIVAYQAQWKRGDNEWNNIPETGLRNIEVAGIFSGDYLVRVRAINSGGASSLWASSVLTHLTGRIGDVPKPVGLRTTAINWGIQVDWSFPVDTGDTLQTELQYSVNGNGDNPLLLAGVPYPQHTYTQLGLKAGVEFWYRARLVDRIGNQSDWTDWVRGESNANADDYLGDIADDFLTSADGDRLTSDIDTNLEAALQNAMANHATVEHQWAQYGEVRADILVVKTTIAQVDKAMAEMSTQVQAQFNDVTAALEDKLTAVVDATGASAIYTLKTGVRINGVMYNAGMSIAVLAEAGKPVVTRFGFNANQFVLMSGSGNTQYSPFAVINGQVFISDAFIQYGQITLAKIGELRSANYVQGQTGTIMKSDGTFEMNGAVAGEGATKMTNLNYSVKDGNGVLRVQIGKLTGVF